VWNELANNEAHRGGVSNVFALPRGRRNAGAGGDTTTEAAAYGCAGDADPTTGYTIRVDGQTMVIGGTSALRRLGWPGSGGTSSLYAGWLIQPAISRQGRRGLQRHTRQQRRLLARRWTMLRLGRHAGKRFAAGAGSGSAKAAVKPSARREKDGKEVSQVGSSLDTNSARQHIQSAHGTTEQKSGIAKFTLDIGDNHYHTVVDKLGTTFAALSDPPAAMIERLSHGQPLCMDDGNVRTFAADDLKTYCLLCGRGL